MKFIQAWLKNLWPRRRLMPELDDIKQTQDLYRQVFGTQSGRELIELWIETVMFSNPRSAHGDECIAFAAKCAFIEDIVKALDKAENPSKYEQPNQSVGFNPRRAA